MSPLSNSKNISRVEGNICSPYVYLSVINGATPSRFNVDTYRFLRTETLCPSEYFKNFESCYSGFCDL